MATIATHSRMQRRTGGYAAPGIHRHWWVEMGFVLALYVGYELSRKAVPSDPAAALAHAREVMSLEARLHINIERSVNAWLRARNMLAALSGYYYATFHFVVVIVTLVWLYIKRPALYRRARTVLIIASFSALLVFWFFPVAPPRLAESGLTDIVVRHNVFGAAHGSTGGGFVNIYAAVPSLHVGWAVWAAVVIMRAEPRWRFRHALLLYPALTTFVVVGTANHYIVDAIAGLATIAVSGLLTRLTLPAMWRSVDELPAGTHGVHQLPTATPGGNHTPARLPVAGDLRPPIIVLPETVPEPRYAASQVIDVRAAVLADRC